MKINEKTLEISEFYKSLKRNLQIYEIIPEINYLFEIKKYL
tara:strand:+ start:299 stop:421 length:123 start_codon:yes stop_codon:yes gene_type:complete